MVQSRVLKNSVNQAFLGIFFESGKNKPAKEEGWAVPKIAYLGSINVFFILYENYVSLLFSYRYVGRDCTFEQALLNVRSSCKFLKTGFHKIWPLLL